MPILQMRQLSLKGALALLKVRHRVQKSQSWDGHPGSSLQGRDTLSLLCCDPVPSSSGLPKLRLPRRPITEHLWSP